MPIAHIQTTFVSAPLKKRLTDIMKGVFEMKKEEDFIAALGGEEAVKEDESLRRAAYMLARASRENKKMKEMLEGYGELQSITSALLAIGFLFAAGKEELREALSVKMEAENSCRVQIDKALVWGFLGKWQAAVSDGDGQYDILFSSLPETEKEGEK